MVKRGWSGFMSLFCYPVHRWAWLLQASSSGAGNRPKPKGAVAELLWVWNCLSVGRTTVHKLAIWWWTCLLKMALSLQLHFSFTASNLDPKAPMKTLLSMLVLCDSLWAHGLLPARLLRPWDFPGKNTGVGCHFLLQGIFLTQGSNTYLLHLLHWQADSLPLSHLGSHVKLLLPRGGYMRGTAYSVILLVSLLNKLILLDVWMAMKQDSLCLSRHSLIFSVKIISFIWPWRSYRDQTRCFYILNN